MTLEEKKNKFIEWAHVTQAKPKLLVVVQDYANNLLKIGSIINKELSQNIFEIETYEDFLKVRSEIESVDNYKEINANYRARIISASLNLFEKYIKTDPFNHGSDTQPTDIDYIAILEFLENYQEVPYDDPYAYDISDEEYKSRLAVQQSGEKAAAEMRKIAEQCAKIGLSYCQLSPWHNNSYTKRFLQLEMKYKKYANNPVSISLFVEKEDKDVRFRVSLDIKNDSADSTTMEKYHSHLNLEKEQDLLYVSGSNEWGVPEIVSRKATEIKSKIANNELGKVQICKYVENSEGKTNQDFNVEIMNGVKELTQYYNHVLSENGEEIQPDINENDNLAMNMILYGPPGTGKTYSTAIYAVAICDGNAVEDVKEQDYNDVMNRYRELIDEGRVVFTTFHQSYGYEEFIEGIKPVVNTDSEDVKYTIEPGVFKRFCDKAKLVNKEDKQFIGKVWAVRNKSNGKNGSGDFAEKWILEGVIKIEDITDKHHQNDLFTEMAKGDWVVLGKDYVIDAIGELVDDEAEEIEDGIFHYQRHVKWKATNLNADCRPFNGGKAFSNFSVARSGMKIQNLQKLIYGDKENNEPYVFIIDEINRGNISKIFGELITLIEDTKRAGKLEAASAILPYSGEVFSVPSNVYILGTMNTADRSIALMDTALRRRFQFVEMMPDSDVLREIHADKVKDGDVTLDVAKMLDVVNERITYLYDREHTIGHAFFTGLASNPSVEKLASIFSKSVIPLLQEYFYEDYQKIQLVLGDNGKSDPDLKFVVDEDVKVKDVFKGNPDDVVDLPEKKFMINQDALTNLESYLQII